MAAAGGGRRAAAARGRATSRIAGHAIEARIYAEDPARDFLPRDRHGSAHLRLPVRAPHVRLDSGVREGDEIGVHYDPMIAKLIVWGQDRAGGAARLQGRARSYQVVGVTTNLGFLRRWRPSGVRRGRVDTGFIERHRAELFSPTRTCLGLVLAIGALSELLRGPGGSRGRGRAFAGSPFALAPGVRLAPERR